MGDDGEGLPEVLMVFHSSAEEDMTAYKNLKVPSATNEEALACKQCDCSLPL